MKSNFSFDSELEKQVGLLTEEEEDDDLNEAKLVNLENDDSNWSSLSVLKLSNQHNMTTPVNKLIYYNESEDKSIFNSKMNITENNTKNNVPTSMMCNCKNTDNYNNIIKNNFDMRKLSSSSLYNDKTQDNHTKTNSINNYTKTNSINNYTKTNSINNITNFTNKTNNMINNTYGIWNLKHGFNLNFNKIPLNNINYNINQSYDFHYNPCSLGLGFQNMKNFNNYHGMNNNTQIYSGPYHNNNSNLDNININNELKSNYYENNTINFPQNNFINVNNMNSKSNFFYLNNFNKSQLSMNSLHSLNSSNKNKSNIKTNQKNYNGKNNPNKSKNYNEKLVLMIKSQSGSKSIQKKNRRKAK